MILIYRILTLIVIFFLPLISIYRIIKKKDNLNSIRQKIGIYNLFSKGNLVWFHGSSVGEVLSIVPLIQELEKNKKIKQILITSNTLSSAKVLSKFKFKKTVHQFFPIDALFIVKKFLNFWRPKICIFVESEIWPNMINEIKKRKIPLILLNARITKKSYKRWKKLNSFSKNLFSKFELSLPQNKETSIYLKKLGAKKIKNIGNLKLCETNEKNLPMLNSSQVNYFNKKKVLLIGYSTHDPEESFCADIFKSLRKNKNEIMILIPRHIERSNSIGQELNYKNLITYKHSSGEIIDKNTDVYLVDTYGEAKKFLKYSKIIFTGGSIIQHGGQNPLDAVRQNSIVIHGPYIHNFTEIYEFLSKEKISFRFNNLSQAKKLIKSKNLVNLNTRNKLKKISSKILKSTKLTLLKYV